MDKNKFIVFEGGEGSGKSTQIKKLKEYFDSKNVANIITREPGGVPSAEEIRKILTQGDNNKLLPLTELLLHSAARYEHINKLILPNINLGNFVISDRFIDSSIAYQVYGHNLDMEIAKYLIKLVTSNLKPDIVFVLDINPEMGLKRANKRLEGKKNMNEAENRYEKFSLEFHQKIRKAYLDIANQNPHSYFIIDASLEEHIIANLIKEKIEYVYKDLIK